MTNTKTLIQSFNGGVLTEEYQGQVEDVKYQSGVSVARNMLILPHGPAQNRGGTVFVRSAKNAAKKARMIPFVYSADQAYAIEFGESYLRFHVDGATLSPGTPAAYNGATAYVVGDLVSSGGVNYYCILATTGNAPPNATYWYAMPTGILEVPSPYLEADLFTLSYTQSNDILTITNVGYAPRELRRLGATTWTLVVQDFSATQVAPGSVTARKSPVGATTTRQLKYAVTSVNELGQEESLQSSSSYTRTITNITQANPGVVTTSTAHGLTQGQIISIAGVVGMTEVNGNTYQVGPVLSSTTFSLHSSTASSLSTITFTAYSSGGTLTVDDAGVWHDLTVANNIVNLAWSAASGAARYNIYKNQNGLFGFIGQTTGLTFVDDNITPDLKQTPPIGTPPFSSANNYPQTSTYYEQRKTFGGTNNKPSTLWATRTGTEGNMYYSLPSRATDSFSFRIAATQNNTIRHLVPLQDLLVGTASAVWRITSVNTDAITPDSVSVKPQSYVGMSEAQPVVVNNIALYVAARGQHVREIGYSDAAKSYISGDLSLRAPHLFDGYTIADMSFSQSPVPIGWCTSSSKNLLGITYVPEQEVGAWHVHDTYTLAGQSTIESVCTIPEGQNDVTYMVVKREINGSTVRYIEYLKPRFFTDLQDAYFVDCGATYDNPFTITGATKANPVVVTTSSAHGFSNGDRVDIELVEGMTELNGNRYKIAGVTATTFQLQTDEDTPANVNGTDYTTYKTGGKVRKAVTTFSSGLSHLEGETVDILANGAEHPQLTVTGGAVTLEEPASRVHIGLPITADLRTLPVVVATDAYAQGRPKNINRAYVRVSDSTGIFAGPTFDNLVEFKQRTDEPYGTPPRLRDGELEIELPSSWNDSGYVCLRKVGPTPITIVSMTLEVALGD